MTKYELTIVIAGDATPSKKKAVTEKIEKMIKALKGKSEKLDDWGKLDMAYEIGNNKTGVYLHFPVELGSEAAKEINSRLNLDEDVIRYLLVRK